MTLVLVWSSAGEGLGDEVGECVVARSRRQCLGALSQILDTPWAMVRTAVTGA